MKPRVTTEFQAGQAQIFKNPFLESLTKTDPISNIIVYGLTNLILGYVAIEVMGLSVLQFVGLFIVGLFFWTFAEYMLHRYVFHWVTEAKWSQRFHFIMHGAHHHYPKDEERLLMPPVPGLILASILFGFFFLIFWIAGYTQLVYGFFPGFFVGYLMYSFVHRATHVMRPPKRFKNLWMHHSLHHYQYPDKAFGVSNTFWDKVFGTMPPKAQRKK
ncbi:MULTISPECIES: sterol desaturase family protein [Hanstruepera]|uniref:sterol desaturase family protein n=1 Tax=Hanstruepera TaxID=1707752 RepID=UPI001CA6109A|nr:MULTISPECIES: sterol desaturase family protein [Hanstruepera]